MSSLLSKVNNAEFAFKDESFCVNGPMNKQRDALMQELLLAARSDETEGGDKRINHRSRTAEVQDKIAALEERMREHLITIRFTAVNKGVWQKWILTNPPRKGNTLDASLGYNADSFFTVAARNSAKYVEDPGQAEDGSDATLVDITEAEWNELDKVLTAGDWDRIDMTLISLNQKDGQRGADFLRTGSRETGSSEATSNSPVTSE